MEEKELTKLSDEDLLKYAKTIKNTKLFDSMAIGLLVGISIYSSVKNGFGLLTFLPLVYLPIAKRNNSKRQNVEKFLKERNLNI
jgi:hypothetical protein